MGFKEGVIVKAKTKLISVKAERSDEGKATTVIHGRHADGLNLVAEMDSSEEIGNMFYRQGHQNVQVSWR